MNSRIAKARNWEIPRLFCRLVRDHASSQFERPFPKNWVSVSLLILVLPLVEFLKGAPVDLGFAFTGEKNSPFQRSGVLVSVDALPDGYPDGICRKDRFSRCGGMGRGSLAVVILLGGRCSR